MSLDSLFFFFFFLRMPGTGWTSTLLTVTLTIVFDLEGNDGTLDVRVYGDFLPRRIFGGFSLVCAILRMYWTTLVFLVFFSFSLLLLLLLLLILSLLVRSFTMMIMMFYFVIKSVFIFQF